MSDFGVAISPDEGDARGRAPVQGNGHPRGHVKYKPDGTVAWWEHQLAWQDYAQHHRGQDAEMIARRGGFSHSELTRHLGHEPETWQPRGTR